MVKRAKQEPWTVNYKEGEECGRTYEPQPRRGPSETDLVHAFLLACGKRFKNVLVCRRNTGAIRLEDRFFHAGIAGQCDVYAVGRGGLHYELEFKSLKGKLNPAQIRWRDRCVSLDVPWIEMRPGYQHGFLETSSESVQRWCDWCHVVWNWT